MSISKNRVSSFFPAALSETALDRRSFLVGASSLLFIPTLSEGQNSKPIPSRPIPSAPSKAYLMEQLGHNSTVTSGVFSQDARFVLTGSWDKTACLWETATGKEIKRFQGHSGFVEAVAFSPDCRFVLTGSDDSTARLWETETGKEIRQFQGHKDGIQSVSFSLDGRFVLTGSRDGTARLWETATGKEIRQFQGHTGIVSSVVFSPNGRFVLAGVWDGTACLWETETGKEIRQFQGHNSDVTSVAFSPDGRFVLIGNGDKTAYLWETETGKEIKRFQGHSGYVFSVAFSPDGRYVLIGNCLWETDTGKEMRRFQGHSDTVNSVVFSPDGRSILTGSVDETARLWEAATGKELRRFQGHSSEVNAVAFSPDGRLGLTGSWDGTARLWETASGHEVCRLINFTDGAWAVTDHQGRYDAGNGGDVEGLCWVVANESVALKQFKADYYEPGLLSKILGVNKEPLRKVRSLAEVEIALPPAATIAQKGSIATITLTNRGGGIGPTDVFVNDTLVYTHPANRMPAKSITFTLNLAEPRYAGKILPPSGGVQNLLQVVGHTFDVTARPEKPDYLASRAALADLPAPQSSSSAVSPRVFLLTVGSSQYAGSKLTLRFAAKDAIDFSREVTGAAVNWLGKENVFSTLLASDAEHPELKPARRVNILAALDAIAKVARSTDIVLLYLAGHGVAAGSGDRDYYYVTADADDTTPGTALFPTVTISGRQLSDCLTRINAAKKAVILDTCASGEFGKREGGSDIRRSWEDMKDRTGTYILAGCAADAVSYESSRYNQGLLTYCLLEAMKANDAVWVTDPKAGGPYLDIQKWLGTAENGVQRLVDEAQIVGVQRPEFKAGREARDFYVGKLTSQERQAIRLETPLPILLPTLTVRDEASPQDEDTLGLRAKINELLLSKSARGRGQGYALWKTEAQPGAYRFNVRYRTGAEVTATVSLLRFPKEPNAKPVPVATFPVSASAANLPDKLLIELVRRVEASEAGKSANPR